MSKREEAFKDGRVKRLYKILDLFTGDIMLDLTAKEVREITGIVPNHVSKYAQSQLSAQRRYIVAYMEDEFKKHTLKIDEDEVMTDDFKRWFTKEWRNFYRGKVQ